MNALSINIPANFVADCNNTLARYYAAQTDTERRAVLDRQTVEGLWWAIKFVSKLCTPCMKHNADVGGGKASKHLYGIAADVKDPTGKLNPVQLAIMASGLFGGVGVYWYGSTAFIHVDVRNGHATWLCTQKGVYNYTSSQAFIMPTVRRGSANATAKAANKMLQRLLGLPVDGIFGANTEAAVRAAQKTHSLTVDGVVGPKTWKALAGVQ